MLVDDITAENSTTVFAGSRKAEVDRIKCLVLSIGCTKWLFVMSDLSTGAFKVVVGELGAERANSRMHGRTGG